MKYVTHRGEKIPLIGFGTYRIGENKDLRESEIAAIRYAIENHKMTLIDTAEMYSDGESEVIVSKAIEGLDRKSLFIVDKILPYNAVNGQYEECCRASLKRLNVDYIDLYLLHWRKNVDLADMIKSMESLKEKGLIRHWGVSNFDTADMAELLSLDGGRNCFANQVMYNVAGRGIEFDLLPYCKANDVLLMAYSPLCHDRNEFNEVSKNSILTNIAKEENKTIESLMISFVIRSNDIVTVFKSSDKRHIDGNMKNVFSPVSSAHMSIIDDEFPSPNKKVALQKR